MQIPSLLQIEAECRDGSLAKRIGPISDDTLGYALQRQSPEPVFALSCEIARRLKRNGVLRSDWSRGLVVAAVDGIEICSSFARCCDACMEREIEHKVNGELRTDIQYYHRIVVVAVVSTAFPIPLGVRFQKNGEGEVCLCSGSAPGSYQATGPPLPGCAGRGRSISAGTFRQRGGAPGPGLGLHPEGKSARSIARSGRIHAAVTHGRSRRAWPRDSILALAGGRLACRQSPGAGCQDSSHRKPRRVALTEKDAPRARAKRR